MSLYVVERDPYESPASFAHLYMGSLRAYGPVTTYEVRDCNGRDGEWHATVTMPHEVVEHEGYAVPAFEGDVERIEWERARRP